MSVTMKEVANRAKVSVATVSHVINKTRFVEAETEKRVRSAIQELGYYPNAAARTFKTGKKNLIAFIVPDIANSFYATITEEIESVLNHQQYKLLVANTKETSGREIENLKLLSAGMVDGIVLASTLGSYEEVQNCLPDNFPLVLLDRTFPDVACDTVTISSYQSIYDCTRKLLSKGHSKIGFLHGFEHLSTTKERCQAYLDALRDDQVPAEHCFLEPCGFAGEKNVEQLLSKGCTAIISSMNTSSEAYLDYCIEHRISLSQNAEFVGYADNTDFSKRLYEVPHILQPSAEMGRLAGKHILERLQNPNANFHNYILQSTIVNADF